MKKIIIFTIILLIVLGSLSSTYYIFFNKKIPYKKEEKIVRLEEIDDRISPFTNQGLILEINRIRHRGLLDEIMKFGASWRKKPTFYVITNIDNREYSSYKEYGFTYNTWDTILQEFRILKDVEEEQEKSKIIISIIEKKKNGLFRYTDVLREKINLVYDYRLGRWDGDDFFKDNDGYGHYVGDNFEVWFNVYQTDFDQDGIPYWVEKNVIFTNPQIDDSLIDPDDDGIPTFWEWRWGYNPFIWDAHKYLDPDIDGLENIEEFQMSKWFADPYVQDIYIEADGMKKEGFFDRNRFIYEESMQIVIERFSQHGINVYVDDGWPNGPSNGGGELLDYVEQFTINSGLFLQYYNNHFSDERKGIFRYLLVCHRAGFLINSKFNRVDTIFIGTRPNKISKIFKSFPRNLRLTFAANLLHELGHSLGVFSYTIGGCDNSSYKKSLSARREFLEVWGNYKSVMNYFYIYDKKILDYSSGSNGPGDQNDWKNFFLPIFQMENIMIYDQFLDVSINEVWENNSICLEGWDYSENLTKKYLKDIMDWSPIDPIKCEFNVFIKTDETEVLSERNIRVYAFPIVPISEWVLIKEGYVDSEMNFLIE